MSLYQLVLIIHILSAIVGLGPGFVLTYIAMHAQTLEELKHAYYIRNRVHLFVRAGGVLLLVTGLLMGILNPGLFRQFWYLMSLIIYLIALALAPLTLILNARPVSDILAEAKGPEIPEEYTQAKQKLFMYEHLTNALFIVIIIIMIIKPFA